MSVVYLKNVADPASPTQDATVCGYAALIGVPSSSLHEGLPRVFAPGCFDQWLATGRRPYLALNHIETDAGVMAHSSSVKVWADETGLAFRAADIRPTPISTIAIQSIHEGVFSWCSFKFVLGPDDCRIETVDDGRQMWVIRNMESVIEIGPCRHAFFDATGCWLSSADPKTLDSRRQRLAREWQRGKPAFI